MIIYTTSIFFVPLLMIVWAIDTYLFLLCIRLILSRIPSMRTYRLYQCLVSLTDPIVEFVRQRLTRFRQKPISNWIPWFAVLFVGLMARYLLIWIVVSISQKAG